MMLSIFSKYYPNSKEVNQSHFVMNTFFYSMLKDKSSTDERILRVIRKQMQG